MNKFYQRNLIKEKLQDYILNFIYNNEKYKKLIFTGGTCLRKIYSLPRLSEDLDFDYSFKFDIGDLAKEIENYFLVKEKRPNITIKIANNKRTIFVKFVQENKEVIFVRCDFSSSKNKVTTEINPYYSEKYNFFILSYDLKTLFTNKIEAFLERIYFKGSDQQVSFKGRDLFDLVWFIQFSAKIRFELKPNWEKLESDLKLSKQQIINNIVKKVRNIDKKDVLSDLSPFIESEAELQSFIDIYSDVIIKKISLLI